ncbi:IS1380-Spn1 transposase [Streptococcus pneumoniae]|nr:IS1380-Spn1 transposase [Streptococcus pneumoniae]VOM69874.1 IS1380-Spn1 transposase [Streptococcus pneumoniae]
MNSLPNHHFQNKSFYQLSFDGGHLTQYGGLIFFQELFSQLKLKERISKYLPKSFIPLSTRCNLQNP